MVKDRPQAPVPAPHDDGLQGPDKLRVASAPTVPSTLTPPPSSSETPWEGGGFPWGPQVLKQLGLMH